MEFTTRSLICTFIIITASLFAVEQTLQWDNAPNPTGWIYTMSQECRAANDFISPYICHISKIQILPTYAGSWNEITTAYVWNDSSGFPGSILGQKDFSNLIGGQWCILDVASLHLIINLDQKFYVGVKYGAGGYCIPGTAEENLAPIHGWYLSPDAGITWSFQNDRDIYVRAVIDNDMTPPYVNGQVPASQSNVNPPLNSIVFHCKDDDKGVDPATINFTCTGNGNLIPGTLNKNTSDLHDVICTFTPTNPIGGGTCVLCNVHSGLADGLGNATTSDILWWFTVGTNKVRTGSIGGVKAEYH